MSKTIFIVEDNPSISELMKIIVESEGYEVKVFLAGEKVLSDAEKLKPCLVMMDLWIPGEGGASLVKNLKKGKETSDIPVIIVSARNSLEEIAGQVKADGFLSKPFNIKDLVGLLHKFA